MPITAQRIKKLTERVKDLVSPNKPPIPICCGLSMGRKLTEAEIDALYSRDGGKPIEPL